MQQLGPRLQYFTVVPMGLVLSDWGHLAISGDIFHCHNQAGANLDSEEKPRKLLNILQGKEQPPTREDDPPPSMTTVLWLRTAVLQLCPLLPSQLCGLLLSEQLW